MNMGERYLVALDIGTSRITITIAKVEDNNVQIIYFRSEPSAGIKYSRVTNPSKASAVIRKILDDAEKELGIKIIQVVVGLPKYKIRQETDTMKTPREGKCITAEEISNLKNIAAETFPIADEEHEILFGAVAQSFSTGEDFQVVEDEIIGMAPEYLESLFKLFIGQRKPVTDLRTAFQMAGNVCISREFFSPDATARSVLYESEMENGVALIDFGGGVTSVSIYYGNIMRHYCSIPFGGRNITADIKNECTITEDLAEKIKIAFGACMPEKLQSLSEKELLITTDTTVTSRLISVKYLSEIITARASEIIEAILYEIQASGFADNLKSGLVITGGGANLVNLGNLLKEISGYNVRTGYPKHLFSGDEPALFDTGAATSIGLILMAKNENINCILAADSVADSEDNVAVEDGDGDTEHEESEREPVLDENGKGNLFGYEETGTSRKKSRKDHIRNGNKAEKINVQPTWMKMGSLFFGKAKELYNNINNGEEQDYDDNSN